MKAFLFYSNSFFNSVVNIDVSNLQSHLLFLDFEIEKIQYEIFILFMVLCILFLCYLFVWCGCSKLTGNKIKCGFHKGVKDELCDVKQEIYHGVYEEMRYLSEKMQRDSSDVSFSVELLRIMDDISVILNKGVFYDNTKYSLFSDYLNKSLMLDRLCSLFEIKISIDEKYNSLAINDKIHFVRICQELLSNSLKYSFAKKIRIDFTYVDGKYVFIYLDDGIGYDIDVCKTGNGLANIYARSIELLGEFEVYTSPNEGFRSVVSACCT